MTGTPTPFDASCLNDTVIERAQKAYDAFANKVGLPHSDGDCLFEAVSTAINGLGEIVRGRFVAPASPATADAGGEVLDIAVAELRAQMGQACPSEATAHIYMDAVLKAVRRAYPVAAAPAAPGEIPPEGLAAAEAALARFAVPISEEQRVEQIASQLAQLGSDNAAPGEAGESDAESDGQFLDRMGEQRITGCDADRLIALARRATHPPQPSQSEPVAWRYAYPTHPKQWSLTNLDYGRREAERTKAIIEPLYTHPPQPTDARVAELEAALNGLRALMPPAGDARVDAALRQADATLAKEPWS